MSTDKQLAIAEFITGVDDHSPELAAAVSLVLTDTVAAMLAGGRSELAEPLLLYAGRHASPTAAQGIVGFPALRVPAEHAAFVNGVLGHAIDFDDTVSSMPGHPSSIVLAALLSALDGSPCRGIDFVMAFAVGHEVAVRLGQAIGMGHYNRGWHSTGTIGVFGALAAVARLRGLSTEQTVAALGIATSASAGIRANFGTMTKPLHSGFAAGSGLRAALLAEDGVTGSDQALFGTNGYLELYGTEASNADLLPAALGQPFVLVEPGVTLKKYACCFATHRAIDAMEQIRKDVPVFDAADVESVVARVAPGVSRPIPYSRPRTGFEARFSMEYVLAVGALDGDFGLGAFSDEAVRRPAIVELLERVSMVEDPRCSPGDPDGRQDSAGTRGHIEVEVTLRGGQRYIRSVRVAPGGPGRRLDRDAVDAKWRACASQVPEVDADRVLDRLHRIAELPDVTLLAAELTGGELTGGALHVS